jgi:hypothetical protein
MTQRTERQRTVGWNWSNNDIGALTSSVAENEISKFKEGFSIEAVVLVAIFNFTAQLNVVEAQANTILSREQCQQEVDWCKETYDLQKCKEKEANLKADVAMEDTSQAMAGKSGETLSDADKAKLSQIQKDLAAVQKQC